MKQKAKEILLFALAAFFVVPAVRAGSIAEGISFESPEDMGGEWTAYEGASFQPSINFASDGKKSLELKFPDDKGYIRLKPTITDWTPYSTMRLTIHSPSPEKVLRFLTFRFVNSEGKELVGGQQCDIPAGDFYAFPSTTRTFEVNLADFVNPTGHEPGDKVDLSDVAEIQFSCWIQPESVFYIDELKLDTAQEAAVRRNDAIREDLAELQRDFARFEPFSQCGSYAETLSQAQQECTALLNSLRILGEKEDYGKLTSFRELLTVVDALSREGKLRSSDAMVLLAKAPTDKVFRDEPFRDGRNEFELMAGGRDRESFQVVVIPNRPLNELTVSVDEVPTLEKDGEIFTIPEENIHIYPVGYVEVVKSFYYPTSRTGFWPDVLLPNQVVAVENRLQPYWITVDVPAGQEPGTYEAELKFADGGEEETFNFTVQVRDFSLPLRGELVTFCGGWVDPDDRELIREYCKILLEHRLSPNSMYTNYKWTPREEDLEFCLENGMNWVCLWYICDTEAEDYYKYNPEYLEKIAPIIQKRLDLLKKYGAEDIAAIHGFDELMHSDKETVKYRLEEAAKMCKWLRERFPGVKLSNIGEKMDISTELMDIWFLAVTGDENFADIREQGGTKCFYWVYDDPSFMLDLPGIAPRICSWMAFKEDAKGIGYYCFYRPLLRDNSKIPTGIDWTNEEINANSYYDRWGREMCGVLIYPAPDKKWLPSIRLENMRDGIEDYEYFALLRKRLNGQESPLLDIPDSIVTIKRGDYTRDYDVLAGYRKALADAIEALPKGEDKK